MKKVVGLILLVLGAVIVAFSFQEARSMLGLDLPPFTSEISVMVIGAIFLIVGIFLFMKSKKRRSAEVPIYQGRDIVGYRRI